MSSLYRRHWDAAGRPRAQVLVVHGYAEHSGRYDTTAGVLNAAGFEVHAYDHQGHGKSPGTRGRIDDVAQLVQDLAIEVDWVRDRADGVPVFLLAHSMGGLVAVHYLSEHSDRVDGAVISSPLLAVPGSVPQWKRRLSGLLSAVVPGLPVEKLNSAMISRDPEAVRAYDADPLVYHRPICARTGAQLMAAIETAQPRLSAITCPLLVLHGTADGLAPFNGGKHLFESAGSPDKSPHWDDGGYHELFNDTRKDATRRAVVAWLNRHLPEAE